MNDYTIRQMTRPELDLALSWAAQEGWLPGLYDAGNFYPADEQGFFVGCLRGEPIACISGVKYGDQFGFIGLYIVKPEYRHQGFGIQLWQTAIRYLQGRTIGLDGVVAQQANYQKSGFQLAYRHIRYQGVVQGTAPKPYPIATQAADTVHWEALSAYDRRFFPAPRETFLRSWIAPQQGAGIALVHGGDILGYGVVRACHGGFRIGPLFAETYDVAGQIADALIATLPPGSQFAIDIPEPNGAAIKLADSYSMQPVFETARMYLGEPPILDLAKVFAVTSLELG